MVFLFVLLVFLSRKISKQKLPEFPLSTYALGHIFQTAITCKFVFSASMAGVYSP